MSNDNIVTLPIRKRPVSIWVLWIGNGLLAAFLIAASIVAEDRGYTGGGAAVSGLFGIAISIAAHAMWYGNRWGRIALLAILTVYLVMLVFQSLAIIGHAGEPGYGGQIAERAPLRLILSIVWLSVNYWFLLRKRARVFFA
jgi:hypothetical protein